MNPLTLIFIYAVVMTVAFLVPQRRVFRPTGTAGRMGGETMKIKIPVKPDTCPLDFFLQNIARMAGHRNYRVHFWRFPHVWIPKAWDSAKKSVRFNRATINEKMSYWCGRDNQIGNLAQQVKNLGEMVQKLEASR